MPSKHSEKALARLDTLEVPASEQSILTEAQRVFEETKKLPANTLSYVFDQRTYDSYRQGLAFREAIETALHEGRVDPDETDLRTAKENIEHGINRGVVNQAALNERVGLLKATYGEDFDENAKVGELNLTTADDLAAVLAGLYSAGDMYIGRQRAAILEGIPVMAKEGTLRDTFDALTMPTGLAALEKFMSAVPAVGGLRDAAKQLARKLGDPNDFKNPFSEIDTIKTKDFFDRESATRQSRVLTEAQAALENVYAEAELDPSIEAARRIVVPVQEVTPVRDPLLDSWGIARSYKDVNGFGKMTKEALYQLEEVKHTPQLTDAQVRALNAIARKISENAEGITQMNLGIDTAKIFKLQMAGNTKALLPELQSAVDKLRSYGVSRPGWLEAGTGGAAAIRDVSETAFAQLFGIADLSRPERGRIRDEIIGEL